MMKIVGNIIALLLLSAWLLLRSLLKTAVTIALELFLIAAALWFILWLASWVVVFPPTISLWQSSVLASAIAYVLRVCFRWITTKKGLEA